MGSARLPAPPAIAASSRIRSRAEFARFFNAAFRYAVRPTRLNLFTWALWAVALGTELALVWVLAGGHIYGWEQDLTRLLQRTPGRYLIFDVANFLTNTLSTPFLLLLAAVVTLAVILRHYTAAILLLLTFPLHVLAQFPKALVDRPRPSSLFEGIEGVGGFRSFPSGHAEYVITFYGFITYLLLLHLTARGQKVLVVLFWLSLVLATGLGRVATGRHWPIDTFASYLFGIGLLAGLIWLHRAFRAARTAVLTESDSANPSRALKSDGC